MVPALDLHPYASVTDGGRHSALKNQKVMQFMGFLWKQALYVLYHKSGAIRAFSRTLSAPCLQRRDI